MNLIKNSYFCYISKQEKKSRRQKQTCLSLLNVNNWKQFLKLEKLIKYENNSEEKESYSKCFCSINLFLQHKQRGFVRKYNGLCICKLQPRKSSFVYNQHPSCNSSWTKSQIILSVKCVIANNLKSHTSYTDICTESKNSKK